MSQDKKIVAGLLFIFFVLASGVLYLEWRENQAQKFRMEAMSQNPCLYKQLPLSEEMAMDLSVGVDEFNYYIEHPNCKGLRLQENGGLKLILPNDSI